MEYSASQTKSSRQTPTSGQLDSVAQQDGTMVDPPQYGMRFVDGGPTDGAIQRKFGLPQKREATSTGHKQNKTGLPGNLKARVENLSGLSLDQVKVHYNSPKPERLNALAYTQGTDIHVGPGQEQHVPHETWHVAQQQQGQVRPTRQVAGMAISDNSVLEKEADEMGQKALQGKSPRKEMLPGSSPVTLTAVAPVQRVATKEEEEREYPPKEVQDDLAKEKEIEYKVEGHPSRKPTSSAQSDVRKVKLGEYFRSGWKGVEDRHLRELLDAIRKRHEEAEALDPSSNRTIALKWAVEELSVVLYRKKSSGGGGNLEVIYGKEEKEKVAIKGRPGFEENAQALPGMKKGVHRRHIVAWHTLRGAVGNVINKLIECLGEKKGIEKSTGILIEVSRAINRSSDDSIDDTGSASSSAPSPQTGTKRKAPSGTHGLAIKGKVKKEDLPTAASYKPKDLEVLMTYVLSKINSNVLNLWPGEGYENSLINTYQYLFNAWAEEVSSIREENEAEQWSREKSSALQRRIDEKGGRFATILQGVTDLLKEWNANDGEKPAEMPGKRLSQLLLKCADTFEVDYPYSSDREKFETDQFISKHILNLAPTFLDWAERKFEENSTNKEAYAKQLGQELKEKLLEFLFPDDSKKIGKSPPKATVPATPDVGHVG